MELFSIRIQRTFQLVSTCKIRMDNLKDKIIDYKTYRFNIIFFQNPKIIFQNHIQI